MSRHGIRDEYIEYTTLDLQVSSQRRRKEERFISCSSIPTREKKTTPGKEMWSFSNMELLLWENKFQELFWMQIRLLEHWWIFDSFGKDKTFGERLWQSISVVPQTRFSIVSNRTPDFCLGMWDGGAWWAAGYGVTQSRTRLKWLSSMWVVSWRLHFPGSLVLGITGV